MKRWLSGRAGMSLYCIGLLVLLVPFGLSLNLVDREWRNFKGSEIPAKNNASKANERDKETGANLLGKTAVLPFLFGKDAL